MQLSSYGGKIRYTIKYTPNFKELDVKFGRSGGKPETIDEYFDIIITGGGIPDAPKEDIGQAAPDQFESAKHKQRNKREVTNKNESTSVISDALSTSVSPSTAETQTKSSYTKVYTTQRIYVPSSS